MGPGHLGIGFAAKPIAPRVPLWLLLVATEALDLLSFVFVTIGIEQLGVTQVDIHQGLQFVTLGHIPWSHGLLMSVVWSLVFALLALLIYRDKQTSVVLGLAVFSHWILDFIVHAPDLPLFFADSPLLGLGLWSSGPGLILSGVLEIALLAGGIAVYVNDRKRAHIRPAT